ncbi:hypothetical protein SFB21_0159 [Acinetobacter bouvetii]|uniref:Uncharacterized protein n=1 Tax=Acinetobacter bouvetii TaxID=202951 RepID=A0A811G5H5_9GAMM|nr:hypothetical protein SFB21_0159 [Acinetobacter bouvetii]
MNLKPNCFYALLWIAVLENLAKEGIIFFTQDIDNK